MNKNNTFSDEVKNKFDSIGIKLYNFKHGFDFLIKDLEDEADKSLGLICLLLILKKYFSEIKDEYNKLEEELGVLI